MATRPPEGLSVSRRTHADGVEVLDVAGEVDVRTAVRLGDELTNALARGARVLVVDMSRVTFCDSIGLSTLLRAWKRLPSGGDIRLAGSGRQVLKMLGAAGLGDFLPTYTSVEEALAVEDC